MWNKLLRIVCCAAIALGFGNASTLRAEDKKDTKPVDEKLKDLEALCYACGLGKTDQVLALINKGVEINSNKLGKTPLINAIQGGRLETVKVLMEHGADIHLPGADNRCPVYFAYSNVEVLKYVLSQGGDREVDWYSGATEKNPTGNGMHLMGLICASKDPLPEMIPILVNAGADPNKKFLLWKTTPLILAIEKDSPKVAALVKALIENKVDVNLKNDAGTSPLQAAKKKGNQEVIDLLTKAGAKE